MDNNENTKNNNRPKGYWKELNQPDYRLMAKAFINLYKELGNVDEYKKSKEQTNKE